MSGDGEDDRCELTFEQRYQYEYTALRNAARLLRQMTTRKTRDLPFDLTQSTKSRIRALETNIRGLLEAKTLTSFREMLAEFDVTLAFGSKPGEIEDPDGELRESFERDMRSLYSSAEENIRDAMKNLFNYNEVFLELALVKGQVHFLRKQLFVGTQPLPNVEVRDRLNTYLARFEEQMRKVLRFLSFVLLSDHVRELSDALANEGDDYPLKSWFDTIVADTLRLHQRALDDSRASLEEYERAREQASSSSGQKRQRINASVCAHDSALYECHQCHRLTDHGIDLDDRRALPLCSEHCRAQLTPQLIARYAPGENLTTTFLNRAEAGRPGWLLLHSIAATYPIAATSRERQLGEDFIAGFARSLACTVCRKHFADMIERMPPQLESRTAFVRRVCEWHNEVNQRLGKRVYQCYKIENQLYHSYACSDDLPADYQPLTVECSVKCGERDTRIDYELGDNLTVVKLTREELGRATWLTLHSFAAYSSPSNADVSVRFHRALAELYPCRSCRREYLLEVDRIDLHRVVSSQTAYERWLCEFHNRISAQLGKPVYKFRAIRSELQYYRCDEDEHRVDYYE